MLKLRLLNKLTAATIFYPNCLVQKGSHFTSSQTWLTRIPFHSFSTQATSIPENGPKKTKKPKINKSPVSKHAPKPLDLQKFQEKSQSPLSDKQTQQSTKSPFHQALLSFALNNKKHLIFEIDGQNGDAKSREGLTILLKKFKRWDQARLFKTLNESLIQLGLLHLQKTSDKTASLNSAEKQVLNSTRRLFKTYFNLLQDNISQLSQKEALAAIYTIYRIKCDENNELDQTQLLKVLSKRICDIFELFVKEPIQKVQEMKTVQLMEDILKSPHKLLHQQFIKLILAEQVPEITLSWHEQARLKRKQKVAEKSKNEEQYLLYESLSNEFNVKLLSLWQKTQGINQSWHWNTTGEEKLNKELTQALVDRFVSSQANIDHLITNSNSSKEQRLYIVPILAKYRTNPNLAQKYKEVLIKLQVDLEKQLTQMRNPVQKIHVLVQLLYYVNRSDQEPNYQKPRIEQGELQIPEKQEFQTTLKSLDAALQNDLLRPSYSLKIREGEEDLPELLRLKMIDKHFMMMSWLVANTLKDELSTDFADKKQALISRLCEAHTYMLQKNPEIDIFEPSVTRLLLSPLKDSQNAQSLAYLRQISQTKLIDKKSSLQEAADKIELANIVLDYVPELDSKLVAQPDRQFIDSLLNAIYFGQLLQHTSLFFFRCTHLERVLNSLSEHARFSKERDFWLKSEDMVLRQREQLGAHKLCRLAHIYARVNPSQLFWVELEKTLMNKSSDFQPCKQTAQSLFMIATALDQHGRKNETFWKVFSNIFIKVKDEFSEKELITLTSLLDSANGEQLFRHMSSKYFNESYLLPNDSETVAKLVVALTKHSAFELFPVGENKQPLYVIAVKALLVQTSDLLQEQQQKLIGNTDTLYRRIKQVADLVKLQKDQAESHQIISQLKKTIVALAHKVVENVDKELKIGVQDHLIKFKASILQLLYELVGNRPDQVQSQDLRPRVRSEQPRVNFEPRNQRMSQGGKQVETERKEEKTELFKNHPKFRQESGRNQNRAQSRPPRSQN